jgi:hypothetical protein
VRRIFTSVAPTVITGIAGFLVLLSFVLPQMEVLVGLRTILINIAIIVASIALLLGFARLLSLHWLRFRQRRSWVSLIALFTAVVVFVVLVIDRFSNFGAAAFVFNVLIVPIQGSLGALLTIFLAAAAVRMARRRRTWGTVWFLVSAVIVLITQIPPTEGTANILQPIRDLFNALAMGGLRGLLLGVALGTLAVAFRVLFAIDRPQSE